MVISKQLRKEYALFSYVVGRVQVGPADDMLALLAFYCIAGVKSSVTGFECL